ncbi:hypothetical protein H257_03755 [Aphanomyces astaci]|uniref:Uncharacterized protein n=1 Tax=Aphanomyces astaci TaxID=112090 RepID=W4H014_APHAT|nr:hypothetical protein H257_03755 [Aphanomyces astaci]ETV84589.1 hypothetical protein H257_03755 [Aphanomyces astaci]KAF0757276.1 hypothetical protein AaE_004323 [Aphanomyces astaci]RHY17297.1 hypothetical protein DYB36_009691 [Aphanomyces astaci]RHY19840.1 hypothetical protein DYB25_002921 [Aphanomyces astaci]RHY66111.1 hypothetical protein DYB30_002592 [Aphanomyces astaci]|eukprot:XP_009826281.1 hypothetical protein H257_03755 [Aphanomyces astaci]
MGNILSPVDTINYNFVAGVYGLCTVLFVLLLVIQRYTDSVEGFYIVFAPFLPCLLWSLVVRRNWLAKEAALLNDPKKTE